MKRRATSTPVPATVWVFDALSRLALWGVIALGVVLALRAAWLNGHAPIQQVLIVGDTTHQSERVLRPYLTDSLNGDFWRLDLAAVAAAISDAPWVRRAVVQRDYPMRLRVIIEEHQAVAWWGEAQGNRLVNPYGEIFEASLDGPAPEDWPVLSGPPERAREVLQAYVQLNQSLRDSPLPVRGVSLSPHGTWRATVGDGVSLALGRDDFATWPRKLQQMSDTLSVLRQRYDQALRSIDLRYPNGFAVSLSGISVGPQL